MGPKPWYRKSKFWMAIAGAVVTIANEVFNMGLPPEATLAMISSIVAYILGEGIADGKKQS